METTNQTNVDEEVILNESAETDESVDIKEDTSENKGVAESSFEAMSETIGQAKDIYDFYEKQAYQTIYSTYGLNQTQIATVMMVADPIAENLTYADIDRICEIGKIQQSVIHDKQKKNFRLDKSFVEYFKEMISDVKRIMRDVEDQRSSLKELESNLADAKQDYINYVKSPEFRERKENYRKSLTMKVEDLPDCKEKRALEKKIVVLNNLETCAFLTERLEKYGNKEIDSIMKSFFSDQVGSQVMKKFAGKAKALGFDEKMYQWFFNLEDMFLEEEYYPFNNLFLFVVMRYISYVDRYDETEKMYVIKIINNMVKLIKHTFDTEEDEKAFVDLIRKVDTFFMDKADIFIDKNTTHKRHPARLASEERREKEKKDHLQKLFELRGLEFDPSLDSVTLQNQLKADVEKEKEKDQPEVNEDAALEEEESNDDIPELHSVDELVLKGTDEARDEEEDELAETDNTSASINPYLEVESEEEENPSMVSAEITSIDTPSVEKNIPKVIDINSEDVFDGGMMIEPVIVNKKEEKEKVERFIDPIIP